MDTDTKVNINLETLRFVYSRYKEIIVPVFVIFVALLLLVVVIKPQIEDYFRSREEIKLTHKRIGVLKRNLNQLSNINESVLDSQLLFVKSALPFSKDFAGVLNAVSNSADFAGVKIGDFALAIGDLEETQITISGVPSMNLNLGVTGGMRNVNDFIYRLGQTLPLSEVIGVRLDRASSTVQILFYYRPPPPLVSNETTPITPLGKSHLMVIEKLSSFINIASESQNLGEVPLASPSAPIPTFPF